MSIPKPADTPTAPGQPPESVPIVKKTALKTPREIQLEKDVARLQDRQDGLENAFNELRSWASDLFGSSKPAPTPTTTPQPQKKSALDATLEDLGVL